MPQFIPVAINNNHMTASHIIFPVLTLTTKWDHGVGSVPQYDGLVGHVVEELMGLMESLKLSLKNLSKASVS